MWFSSARFLVFPILLAFATLSLGTPVPQQTPGFPIRATPLEPEDDPERLRRYESYGLRQATVERVQPVANVHPDAAPFTNVPDVRATDANLMGRSSSGGFNGATQGQQANGVSLQVPETAPLSAEQYSGRRDGMGGSALPEAMVPQTMGTQAAPGIRTRSMGDAQVSEPAMPTSDASLQMSSGTGAYSPQAETQMGSGAEQVPESAGPAMSEAATRNVGGSSGLVSSIQTASHGNTNSAESNVGAQGTSLAGMSTVRQGIMEHTQDNVDSSNFYNSRMAESTAAQGGHFNGQEGAYSQYGERVDAGGMQMRSQGLGVSGAIPGAIPGNVGNEAFAVRTSSDGPTVGGRAMVA